MHYLENEIIHQLESENVKLRKQLLYLQSIHDFAEDLIGISDLNEIAWIVTDKLHRRFGFEDCVIYIVKEGFCHQVAAFGPKNPEGRIILNPISIKVGEGIVGAVAETGIAEIIKDTSLDSRYIVDDKSRLSELTVPIFFKKEVIGIIDSEHSKRDFFTNEHFNTVASVAKLISLLLDNAIRNN